jgi:hypothetical protein
VHEESNKSNVGISNKKAAKAKSCMAFAALDIDEDALVIQTKNQKNQKRRRFGVPYRS